MKMIKPIKKPFQIAILVMLALLTAPLVVADGQNAPDEVTIEVVGNNKPKKTQAPKKTDDINTPLPPPVTDNDKKKKKAAAEDDVYPSK